MQLSGTGNQELLFSCRGCVQGFVPKEAVRGQYDGSLFYQLARKQDAARKDTREKRT